MKEIVIDIDIDSKRGIGIKLFGVYIYSTLDPAKFHKTVVNLWFLQLVRDCTATELHDLEF